MAAVLACAGCTVERVPAGLGPPFLRVAGTARVSDQEALSPPAWAPGGGRLAFGTADSVWEAGLDGGGARRLASLGGVTEIAWGGNGRVLLAVSDGGLYAVGRAGEPPERVPATEAVRLVAWAPGRAGFAYAREASEGDEVMFRAGTRGDVRTTAVAMPAGFAVRALCWLRGGQTLFIGAGPRREAAATRIFEARVTRARPVLTRLALRDAALGLVPDPEGRFVVYVTGSAAAPGTWQGRVTVARVDGTGRRALTPAGRYTGLAWSPSGTLLAYGAVVGPGEVSLDVVDVVTGARLRVADYRPEVAGRGGALSVRWAPDGRRLAFGTDTGDGAGPVWVATLERE